MPSPLHGAFWFCTHLVERPTIITVGIGHIMTLSWLVEKLRHYYLFMINPWLHFVFQSYGWLWEKRQKSANNVTLHLLGQGIWGHTSKLTQERNRTSATKQCDIASIDANHLIKHFKIHSGERSFKCNQCNIALWYCICSGIFSLAL